MILYDIDILYVHHRFNFFITQEIDVEFRDSGRTPLHFAVEEVIVECFIHRNFNLILHPVFSNSFSFEKILCFLL